MLRTAQLGATSKPRHNHAVGFYENDEFLTELVVDFVGPAIVDDETAVVIASKEHRKDFLAALEAIHPDITGAIRRGQLVMLDVYATRRTLMPDGVLDPARFFAVVGELFAQASERSRPVRIFGNVVATLWEDRDTSAALALEDLWNDLAVEHPFELMCAYPLRDFSEASSDAEFRTVCERHSAITNESYARLGHPGSATSPVVVLHREDEDREV